MGAAAWALGPSAVERPAILDRPLTFQVGHPGSQDCADRRQGGKKTPFCNLTFALDTVPDGALLLVRGGQYGRLTVQGKRDRKVTLRPYPGEGVEIQGATILTGRLKLRGFRITGTVSLAEGVGNVQLVGNHWVTDGSSGDANLSLVQGNHDVLVAGNRIAQTAAVVGTNAIDFNSTNTRPEIRNVTIRGNRIGPMPGGGDAIQAKHTRGLLIEGNEFSGVSLPAGSEAHPDVLQSIYGAVDLTLRGNFIHDINAQGIAIDLYQAENRNVLVEDNVIVRVAYPWVAMSLAANGATVHHNTIDGTLRMGRGTVGSRVVSNILSESLLLDSGVGVVETNNLSRRFSATPGPGSIVGSPRFRSYRRDDFRLRRRSPGWRDAPHKRDIGARRADRFARGRAR